jgi:hypothetical protein
VRQKVGEVRKKKLVDGAFELGRSLENVRMEGYYEKLKKNAVI